MMEKIPYLEFFQTNVYAQKTVAIIGLILLTLLSYWLAKKLILSPIVFFIKKSKSQLDDLLLKYHIFNKVAAIIPALILYLGAYVLPFTDIFQKIAQVWIIFNVLWILVSLLDVCYDIYKNYRTQDSHLPIKGYIQIVKMLVFLLGGIVMVAAFIGKSPVALLSGIGAMTAVLMLIFKDTILSLVASLQITLYNLIRVGDWIEMPKFNADGDVLDISLHTIKVQNWDKTIVSIPTHTLLNEAFKNWRGMEESGGRRIKRSINIDLSSVKFCEDSDIEQFKKIDVLKDYIEFKTQEVNEDNKQKRVDTNVLINGRRLTNVGTFRAYIQAYLKNHPLVRDDMTFMVRQLQPGEHGLPLQIYLFVSDTRWVEYENIQADLFDHILASVPEFGLRLFQQPTGQDLQVLKNNL